MLAVAGVPQLLTHYLESRNRQRDRQEDIAAAEQRRREDIDAAEQRRREDIAVAEQRRREDMEASERRRLENREIAERRHQETIAILGNTANLVAALLQNQQSAPAQAVAIAELQQSVAELTRMVSDMQHKMQNGNGSAPAQSND